jgi:superfamily II RNA helicase
MTELLFTGDLPHLPHCELLAIISCLTTTARKPKSKSSSREEQKIKSKSNVLEWDQINFIMEQKDLSPKFCQVFDKLVKLAEQIFNLERDNEIYEICGSGGNIVTGGFEEKLNPSMAFIVYEWSNGKDFVEICKGTEIEEGIIVREMMRLEYCCRELCVGLEIMGDTDLKNKITKAQETIKRDIIFTPSLYIK